MKTALSANNALQSANELPKFNALRVLKLICIPCIFQEVKTNPSNYDAWFDYLRLMESEAEPDAVREVYERAIAIVPPAEEKRLWRRYIYLWINYALYEELIAKVNIDYKQPVSLFS